MFKDYMGIAQETGIKFIDEKLNANICYFGGGRKGPDPAEEERKRQAAAQKERFADQKARRENAMRDRTQGATSSRVRRNQQSLLVNEQTPPTLG